MKKKEICIASKYKLGKKIGCGAFGDIFTATDIQTGKTVALKLVIHS